MDNENTRHVNNARSYNSKIGLQTWQLNNDFKPLYRNEPGGEPVYLAFQRTAEGVLHYKSDFDKMSSLTIWEQVQNLDPSQRCCVFICFPCVTSLNELNMSYLRGVMPQLQVSGLPIGAKRISKSESREILQRWEGMWEIVSDGRDTKMHRTYKQCFFLPEESKVVYSGGTHTNYWPGHEHETSLAENKPRTLTVAFYRVHPDGPLYTDHIGGELVHEIEGELMIKHAVGSSMLLRRQWKQQGSPALAVVPSVQAVPVITSSVQGVEPAFATAPMERGGESTNSKKTKKKKKTKAKKKVEDIPEQILKLSKLADAGVITQAEFENKKAELLARM